MAREQIDIEDIRPYRDAPVYEACLSFRWARPGGDSAAPTFCDIAHDGFLWAYIEQLAKHIGTSFFDKDTNSGGYFW